ncbi:ATPase family associated with various cellular activities (AAA) domain-containing protein [Phthorimaea operculella]|nr:ATPase family associated with various cellular activities (AAA) domain-containing protein [Phthorimaea operculella]
MSRDIRSFFQPKKAPAKPAKPVILDDDDDVIPESPDVQIKNRKKESRKKRCISDSDEEIFDSKKKKIDNEPTKTSSKKDKTPNKPALKEVKVVDLFGTGPIKRTEPLVKKEKKKTETGIHSDEEFEKSLLEVDAEALAPTDIKTEKSPAKETELEKATTKDIKAEKSPSKHHSDSTKKEKEKHKKKETSPHKLNGDSHSQEINNKEHKSKDSKHSDSKKNDKKSDHSDSKKNDKRSEHSHSKKNDKKSEHSDSKKKDTKTEHVSPKKSKDDSVSSVFFDKEEDKAHKDKSSKKESSSHKKEEKKETASTSKEKKRDFSEFVDSDISIIEDHEEPKPKKKKMDKSLNESVLTDEERHERRMQSAALYKSYLNRSGPKHLGSKEMPEGAPNCLANCAFLLTGVLDSFEREDITDAITKYGGCVKSGISKKVTHVLAGDDAGPAKMAKAQELGIKIISEDDFLQMIRDSTKKSSSNKLEIKKETKKEKSPSRKTPKKSSQEKLDTKDKDKSDKDKADKKDKEKVPKEKSEHKNESKNHDKEKSQELKIKDEKPRRTESAKSIEIKSDTESKSSSSIKSEINGMTSQQSKSSGKLPLAANSIMWVEKYKPQNIKQIIGQHGDASNVKKLMNWLTKWYVNRKAKLPKPSPWAKNDDGGFFKAALLSGPPGVGKTTTVALVCKELGFDMVEFNASDTRNKSLIKEQIGELLTTTSLSAYAKGDTGKQAVTKKHVLVMDEVDGMAGNEDRGGLQELIALIKSTAVPIICMCNDRNSPKMRTLVNYCYDLRFNRPRVEQIKSAMMSVCCKEGVKIPPDALTQLIVAANQDVRQTLNLLSMWAIDPTLMDAEKLKKDAQGGFKDLKLGPWEAVRKVFSAEDHKNMSINDKSDLFFYDYSLSPLFVQENYLQVAPHCPKNEVLDRIAKAADSISLGNLVDSRIRGSQAWSLLPVQAMYASVIPGSELSGHVAGQINFPAWLGNNSKTNKMHRLCQEIHAHTRLSTSGSKSSIFLDYAPHLRDAIVTPLLKEKSEGIDKSLEVLESYHLLREDLDSLVELSLWSGQRNPMILIDSKIKAAMTRTYNKKAMALPYAPGAVKKGRAKDLEAEGDGEEGEGGEDIEEDEQDSDPENDALIKKKKTKEEKPSTSKAKAGTSKEKPSVSKEKNNSKKKK